MKLNSKGITLFELLATISVAAIVLTLLSSILFSTLFAKNTVEYGNRLDDEIYDINSFLSGRFQNIGYGSIRYYPSDNPNYHILIITNEFNPVGASDGITISRETFYSKILLIDTTPIDPTLDTPQRNGVYFDILFEVDINEGNIDQQIRFYVESIDAYVTQFLFRPTGKISSDNLIIESASLGSESDFCTRRYNQSFLRGEFDIDGADLVSTCSNAFVSIEFNVSYQLRSGEALNPRFYSTTLYF